MFKILNKFILVLLVSLFTAIFADEKSDKELKEWRESRVKESKDGWHFSFEEDEDSNRFPDNWGRSKNYKLADGKTLAFASWAEINLDSKIKKDGNYSLHFFFQGAQPIGLETDAFKIDNFSAYELSSWFNLDPASSTRTKVIMGIYWYDKDLKQLPQQTEDHFTVEHTSGWELRRQRINLLHASAVYAKIYMRVEGEDNEAHIWVDETRFYKRPRISIETNKFLHIFNEDELFALKVNIRGLEVSKYFLDVNILNIFNENIFSNTQPVIVTEEVLQQQKGINLVINPTEVGSYIDKNKPEKNRLVKGVFKVNVILRSETDEIGGNSIRIGRTKIDKRMRIKDDGEIFGITLDSLENAYQLRNSLDLMGVLRVKLPVWDKNLEWEGTQYKSDEIPNRLADIIKEVKSGENQPEIIGVFAPRPRIIENAAEKGILNLVRADEKIWKPYFDNAIYNFRTTIKMWQLGDDHDSSFTNDEKQQLALEKLNPYLEKAGQVGGATKILSNNFLLNKQLLLHRWLMFYDFEYTDNLNFTEIEKVMSNDKDTFSVKKWVTIPIKSKLLFRNDLYPAIDLFKKVVWARKNNIKRIFAANYQDEYSGLINQKNELTPALIAYKLGIDNLSEVTYMGSLPEFGNEIENFVFSLNQNPKKAILVAWTKRSDELNKKYDFTEAKLIKLNKTLEDVSEELKKPDVVLNHQLIAFFPDLIFDKTRAHFTKGLNNIINTPNLRKLFLEKYSSLGQSSKTPSLRELINNKYKKENEEKEAVRYILEEIYPNSLYNIELVQKNILLDQEVEQVDLMGNSLPVTIKYLEGDPYQEIKINQFPTIFTGLSSDFIKTRISIKLDTDAVLYSRLESQKQTITINNCFDQPMDGIFIIKYPLYWKNTPFVKFHLEKGETKSFPIEVIPSRIASPGPISIGLQTTFTTDRKYTFRSEREIELVSDLIVGKPNEKIAILPPKFGDASGRFILNIPISLKPTAPENKRPSEIDVVVTLDLPDETSQFKVDKVQADTFRMATFPIKLKKEYNNKKAKIRIEQRGSNTDSFIFHNLDVPIPDAE